jgi:hypothetical protein
MYDDNNTTLQEMGVDVVLGMAMTLRQAIK